MEQKKSKIQRLSTQKKRDPRDSASFARLKTPYDVGRIPHREHPHPQRMRKDWLCLNGEWELTKQSPEGNALFSGKILVPFSPETINGGLEAGFRLEAGERLLYRRSFTVDKRLLRGVTHLHFGAVDSECEVSVNGLPVGTHRGGFTAFTLDVSAVLREGENEICVLCRDEATRNEDPFGKQSDLRGGIWYTPQSGIWQTVWLESMPREHIRNLLITTDAEKKTVTLKADCFGRAVTARVLDGEREILSGSFTCELTLAYDFALWSPDSPKLYNLVLTSETGDELRSYFGVRSFSKGYDEHGKMRLLLNGKPFFFNGLLDQGYWSDGMLTYPSDKAAEEEIRLLREMGFNTLRKHIKFEPMRWYYHCDRLGMLVWQDFVNGGGGYKFTHIAAFPFLGIQHRDSDYRYFAREDADARAHFIKTAEETVRQLQNCVCIALWVPFNEGWGQFDSAEMTERVRAWDPTRLIDSVSGWHDQGVGKTEMRSLHIYYTPLTVPKDPRPVVLSEFGGYSMKVEGHVFDRENAFGYKVFPNQARLCDALEKLYLKKLLPLIRKGLCGCIYTQVSDVEEEINGLVTYDRQVIKVPVAFMRRINDRLLEEANNR